MLLWSQWRVALSLIVREMRTDTSSEPPLRLLCFTFCSSTPSAGGGVVRQIALVRSRIFVQWRTQHVEESTPGSVSFLTCFFFFLKMVCLMRPHVIALFYASCTPFPEKKKRPRALIIGKFANYQHNARCTRCASAWNR